MEITGQRPSRRVARLLLALLLAIGMGAAVSAATQQRAFAASCSVQTGGQLNIDGQNVTQVIATVDGTCANQVIAHNCLSMGANGGVTAIECVDIYMTYSASAVEAWGEGEYYCQGPSGYAQCAGMSVDQAFYWDANTSSQGVYGHPGGDYTCSGGSCPAGGRALVDTYHYLGSVTTECTVPIIAKTIASNSITVPNGTRITNPAVASTPLISVCWGS
ncbi:MAG TPA: hypothetical protein VMU95_00470 [Trebonia sp.]|nr:hypothetical protein [Trebonia sp.]